jgi:hypothetical protein
MSKERAISLLETAKNMESVEDARRLINKAILSLRTEVDLVPGLEISRDMIWEGLQKINANMPHYADSPSERSEKIHIIESALSLIKEYATTGLKARAQGSMDVAEDLLKSKMNPSLQDFGETEVTITGPDGKETYTTAEKFNRVCEAVQRDPRIINRTLEGDQ